MVGATPTVFLISDKIMDNDMVRYVGQMGNNKNTYKILTGIPEGNRSLTRSGRRWEHNIK
jgi:hypothetical protein